MLVREIRDGVEVTDNLGKTPAALTEERKASRRSKQQLPTLSKNVSNIARAAGRVVKAIVTHKSIRVSDEEKERRLSICRDCEFYTANGRCEKCGCFIRFKTRLETEHCPIEKW